MSELPRVVVVLRGGLLEIETKTAGLALEIRDYDAAEEDPIGRDLQIDEVGEAFAVAYLRDGDRVVDSNAQITPPPPERARYSGTTCPACEEAGREADLEFLESNGPVHVDEGTAWQDWECRTCGLHFRDVYELAYSAKLDDEGEETGLLYVVGAPFPSVGEGPKEEETTDA